MIYLDNAATTWPKPPEVLRAMCEAVTAYGANPGRGGYPLSEAADRCMYRCRSNIARFFGVGHPDRLIFTPGCTWSINTALSGLLCPGSHVIISNLEHNAVVRPLHALEKQGVSVTRAAVVEGDPEATVRNFAGAIKRNTKMIFCTHASNVFGVKLPVEELGRLCRRYGLIFGIDAAQSAGTEQITVGTSGANIICAPAHKGLYGVMGAGVLALDGDVQPQPLIRGGTGSLSARRDQPDILPDLYESGTPPMPAICALDEGIRFIEKRGIELIRKHELELVGFIYDELRQMNNIVLYTSRPAEGTHVPILAFNAGDMASGETAERLAEKGVCVRAGYHCSYDAHLRFGTQDRGAVRVAPSVFTSYEQAVSFLRAVHACI